MNILRNGWCLLRLLALGLPTLACVVPSHGSDVVITYEVGWWPEQENLHISAVSVEKGSKVAEKSWIGTSKVNVIVTIEGTLTGTKSWRPAVTKLHVAQQMPVQLAESIDTNITIMPIVDFKMSRGYNGEVVPFKIVQSMAIPFMGWGSNIYHFRIGAYSKDLEFGMSK